MNFCHPFPMNDEIETAKNNPSKNLGLHTLPNSEESEAPEDNLHKAVSIILNRKQPLEHLVFRSPEGMRTIHLAFPHYENTEEISFMFKRCPELKPFYPKIRSWFETNNLEWKDRSFNNDRYMRVDIVRNEDFVHSLVKSAHEEIFGTEVHSAISMSNSLGLQSALQDMRSPILMLFSVAAVMVSMTLYPLYEIYHLRDLGPFSFSALNWTEGFLLSIFILGFLGLRYCAPKAGDKNQKRKWRAILHRIIVLLCMAFAFFTY